MQPLLQWLARLDPAALYAVAAGSAALENVFPPLPSDAVVAFAAFAAARGRGAVAFVFTAVLAGNVAGALFTYGVGARYGAAAVLPRFGATAEQERQIRAWYRRYGLLAIAASRMLPGVRAVVPPVAGALGIGVIRTGVATALPSALWYGVITYLAFTAGGDFDAFTRRIGAGQRWVGLGAGAIAVAGLGAWLVRRRRARA